MSLRKTVFRRLALLINLNKVYEDGALGGKTLSTGHSYMP